MKESAQKKKSSRHFFHFMKGTRWRFCCWEDCLKKCLVIWKKTRIFLINTKVTLDTLLSTWHEVKWSYFFVLVYPKLMSVYQQTNITRQGQEDKTRKQGINQPKQVLIMWFILTYLLENSSHKQVYKNVV